MYEDYGIDLSAELARSLLTTSIIALIVGIVLIVAIWKIFTKAGEPGWASIVPFYNLYVLYKITWGNGWLFLIQVVLGFVALIPFIGGLAYLASMVIGIITIYKLAKAFGKGVGFTLGLIFLSLIFWLILAFGDAKYIRNESNSII